MSTTKAILFRYQKNAAGESPVYIRITKNGQQKYLAIGINVKEDQWNKANSTVNPSCPDAEYVNNYIKKKVSEASSVNLQMNAEDKYVSQQKVKDQIMGRIPISFIKYAERFLIELEHTGTVGTLNRYKS